MKILAISAGSVGGNTELLLLAALQSAQATYQDSSVSLIRLHEAAIGNNLIAGQFAHPFVKERKQASDKNAPDDRSFVLDAIMNADAILLGAPVLNRSSAGLLKWFADKTLGPFQDISVATEMKATGRAHMVDERIFKPRVAALVCVGGAVSSDWTTFGLPMMHQLLFPMAIKVVDQMQVHGAGLPGCVALDEQVMARAVELGRNLATQMTQPVEQRGYLGAPGRCPICHLDVIKLLGGKRVECATCAATGTLDAVDGELQLHFAPTGLEDSVFRIEALVKHGTEIKKVAAELKPRMGGVLEKTNALVAWAEGVVLTLPSLADQSASE